MKPDRSLERYLLLRVLLISGIATTIFTGISFYLEYLEELNDLETTFHQASRSYTTSLSNSLWELQEEALQSQLEGILGIPDVVRAEVRGEFENRTGNIAIKEDAPMRSLVTRHYPLKVQRSGKTIGVGRLSITATKVYMHQRLKQDIITFFISSGIKTLLVSVLILLLFRIAVVRHLETIALYAGSFSSDGDDQLFLQGKRRTRNELDIVAEKIREMSQSIRKVIRDKSTKIDQKQKELRAQKDITNRSSRLAGLGQLAAGIAHEINNPLSIVQGNVILLKRALKRQNKTSEEMEIYAARAVESVGRISEVTSGLLEICSDIGREVRKEIMVGDLVGALPIYCRARMQNHGIEFQIRCPDDGLDKYIDVDKSRLTQVLISLLYNAVDAVIRTKNPWITLEIKAEPGEVVLSVTDSGPGIPAEIRDKVLEPFFSTKCVGSGSGLGLSISVGIVEAHGGCLFLDEDCPNTRFTIRLPLAGPALKAG